MGIETAIPERKGNKREKQVIGKKNGYVGAGGGGKPGKVEYKYARKWNTRPLNYRVIYFLRFVLQLQQLVYVRRTVGREVHIL